MEVWGIQEAQFSLIVSGLDYFRWVGYGFINAEIDGVLAESFNNDLSYNQLQLEVFRRASQFGHQGIIGK